MLGTSNTCVRLQSKVTSSGARVNCWMIQFYFVCLFCFVLLALLLLLLLTCLLVCAFRFGTIHKVCMLLRGGRVSRQKCTSIVFMTSFYCVKAYKAGRCVWKSPDLNVCTLMDAPFVLLLSLFWFVFVYLFLFLFFSFVCFPTKKCRFHLNVGGGRVKL